MRRGVLRECSLLYYTRTAVLTVCKQGFGEEKDKEETISISRDLRVPHGITEVKMDASGKPTSAANRTK